MKQARRSYALYGGLVAAFLLLACAAFGGWGRATPASGAASFADPAFSRVWERTDRQVAAGQVGRTWLWGPQPGMAVREPWAESPGGQHLVQYFDKGRMEVNDPGASPDDPFYVTNGLLAFELVSGEQQTGRNTYTKGDPAAIPIAGDRDDANAPTYASFRPLTNLPGSEHRALDSAGQPVSLAITQDGRAVPLGSGSNNYGVRYAFYDPETGHNVPDVFWRFLNSQASVLEGGKAATTALFQPWFAVTGLPISEAYWSRVKIAGKPSDVLIQVFQRRALTYTPGNPEAFRVELGNIGLHYVEWRYGGGGQSRPLVRIVSIANEQGGVSLNRQAVTLQNFSGSPIELRNWQLIAPHPGYSDRYAFPAFSLPKGGTVTIYAGSGKDTPTQLYMGRLTWFFDGGPYDGVALYDAAAHEVHSYFLIGGLAPTPETLPTESPTPDVIGTVGVGQPPPPEGTAAPEVTATARGTAQAGTTPPATPQAKPTNDAQPRPTSTTSSREITPAPVVGTSTPTPAALPTGTPTAVAFDDTTTLLAWVDNPAPKEGSQVTLYMKITNGGEPSTYASLAATWHFPGHELLCQATSDYTGVAACTETVPQGSAGATVWIDIAALGAANRVYTTYTGIRPGK